MLLPGNRTLFYQRLKESIEQAKEYNRKVIVLFIDLDNFKRINDTLEHWVGDLLLQDVAERLNESVRTEDLVARQVSEETGCTVARLGGDEFTILLSDINCEKNALIVAERIRDALSIPFKLADHELSITASIGIAAYPDNGKDLNSLLKNADTAMYNAKSKGKNNFQLYSKPMNDTVLERLYMETGLRNALKQDELLIYYQYIVDAFTEEIVGTEALIRWNRPGKGLVSPLEFLPLAIETGLIVSFDKWVLKTACTQNKEWHNSGYSHKNICVNISDNLFQQEDLATTISDILHESGLDPKCLCLEISENTIMQEINKNITMLQELKKTGVQLAMDDFGTGYSSFSSLKHFPLDIIKIDISLIKDMVLCEKDAGIVKAIISMAKSLKLKVVAEGIETEEQLDCLRKFGCDEIQGFLFSRPFPADEVTKSFIAQSRKILAVVRSFNKDQ